MDKKDTVFNSKLNSDTDNNIEEVTLAEHLSALFDDEVGSFEQRRVLDELKSNDDLSKNLSRFSLIGESMRSSQSVAVAGSDFLANIHAQIDSEPEYNEVVLQDQTTVNNIAANDSQSSWFRPISGFAIAASVAAVAVVGFQNYQTNEIQQSAAVIASSVPVIATPQKEQLSVSEMNSAVVVSADKMDASMTKSLARKGTSKEYQFADARARSLLKRFVDKHIRHAPTSSFVPSVRVIAYADYK